ncbi:MAG: hypothetical protein E6G44_06035 [Actinobacteria bacterium]|nr:MAG: hypothetical protein E6G44_06035 [Actinomycetota bacterium]
MRSRSWPACSTSCGSSGCSPRPCSSATPSTSSATSSPRRPGRRTGRRPGRSPRCTCGEGSGGSRARPRTIRGIPLALVGIIGKARIFVLGVDTIASTFHVPPLVLALLLAPLATELPEKFNSVIWVRRKKDTLALGNITGALVFQSSFPVTIGLLLTPWHFSGSGNVDELVAAVVALVAGSVLWISVKIRGSLSAPMLLLQGAFYAGYVVFVLARI